MYRSRNWNSCTLFVTKKLLGEHWRLSPPVQQLNNNEEEEEESAMGICWTCLSRYDIKIGSLEQQVG